MLHLILVDTALELIPKAHHKHPSVIRGIQRFRNAGKLLDSSLHHSLMPALKDSQKRGRPDILHHFMLDGLSSIANSKHQLGLHFHCSSGVYTIDPQLRCPRDTPRFKGLMYQLLNIGHIPQHPPYFISRSQLSLADFISDELQPAAVFKMTREGDLMSFQAALQLIADSDRTSSLDVVVLVGGFQKSHFSAEIKEIPGHKIALGTRGYDSWAVINRILVLYEHFMGFLEEV